MFKTKVIKKFFYMLTALIIMSTFGNIQPVHAGSCGDTTINTTEADVLYDAINDNGPGKIGPRRLVTSQTGSIVTLTTRRFIQHHYNDINNPSIEIKKTGGRGKTGVTVCLTDQNGQQTVVSDFIIDGGTSNTGQSWTINFNNAYGKRISVHFVGKSLIYDMDFTMWLRRPNEGQILQPNMWVYNTNPVAGYADIHIHHMAAHSYGGGLHPENGYGFYGGVETAGNDAYYLAPHGATHGVGFTLPAPIYNPFDNEWFTEVTYDQSLHSNTLYGYPNFNSWPAYNDIAHQQTSATDLLYAYQNGLSLAVMSIVSNQWLCAGVVFSNNHDPQASCHDMESVKNQIYLLKEFDAQNSWFKIVTDPWDAKRTIQEGKLAVVMAVEVSNLMPSSEGLNWQRQLDELYSMGVRSIQIVHETNSRFGGAAAHNEAFQTAGRLKALFGDADYVEPVNNKNPLGLNSTGQAFLQEMINKKMVIDLAHLSENSLTTAFQILQNNGYPAIYSHSRIYEMLTSEGQQAQKEFLLTNSQVQQLAAINGIIGLRTGDNPMVNFVNGSGQTPVANNCTGSTRSFAQLYQQADALGVNIAFGSDFNGFISQMAPRFGPNACRSTKVNMTEAEIAAEAAAQGTQPSSAAFHQKGLASVRYLNDVIVDMRDNLGVDTSNIESSAETFIQMWMSAY